MMIGGYGSGGGRGGNYILQSNKQIVFLNFAKRGGAIINICLFWFYLIPTKICWFFFCMLVIFF